MNIKAFFDPLPKIQGDLPYHEINPYIQMCDVISKVDNKSAYIIDYAQQGFLHVSPHPLFLNGHTQKEVKEMGYNFYKKILSSEDLQMILEVNKMGWDYFYKMPIEERLDWLISYSFYLYHQNGKTLVQHQLCPIRLTEEGNVWLAMCFVSHSPYKEPGNVIFSTNNKQKYYKYEVEKRNIIPYTPPKLTKRETEIMNLTLSGYEEQQIAERLHVSLTTIKKHRYNMIKKMSVNNLSNAVAMYHAEF